MIFEHIYFLYLQVSFVYFIFQKVFGQKIILFSKTKFWQKIMFSKKSKKGDFVIDFWRIYLQAICRTAHQISADTDSQLFFCIINF